MLASIVIRTLNEDRYLDELLTTIARQETGDLEWEVVLVDSGSTDATLKIAKQHDCRIFHITREQFSFGRSLNMGCEAARGDMLVLISGHCVPADRLWLQALCKPIADGVVDYTYGRQLGGPESFYSERRIFAKYFPECSEVPQQGFYCNNANSALSRSAWLQHRFDEELTGLEDMELARRLIQAGGKVGYVAEAAVYHHHNETWRIVKRRFEREAIALQYIMPQVHIRKRDLVRYVCSSIWLDLWSAWKESVFTRNAWEIFQYRRLQYWGSYVGNNELRKLSHAQKEQYFYPSLTHHPKEHHEQRPYRWAAANEGKQ